MPGYRKLGRPTAHRKAMLRNIVTDLFREAASRRLTAEPRKQEEKLKR
jgi:large subunit ribosomal protein L17